MATRRERCGRCGVRLLVPQDAVSIQCMTCGSVSRPFRYHDPISKGNDSIHHAAGLVRGLIGNTNSLATPMTAGNFYYPRPSALNHAYSPPPPPLLPAPPAVHGRKRAVLCGVSYYGKRYKLKGSVNDVKCMRYFLEERMGFPSSSILVLTEEESDPARIPTRHNILMALRWLVHGVRPGDSLVFHFSGHGSRQEDMDMDEIDGYDETICPVDHDTSGKIVDDEINSIIVRPLPRDARLHAIFDSCYSGTVLDLPFLCKIDREGKYRWEDQRLPMAAYKGTNGGIAICISACDDHQTSADTSAFTGNTVTGAMTYSFIQAMENELSGRPTYGRLVSTMRSAIREAKTGVRLNGPVANLINRAIGARISQEPQLSSSEKFDIYSSKIVL